MEKFGADILEQSILLPTDGSFVFPDSMTECFRDYLKWNTANRWLSDFYRHNSEAGYILEPKKEKKILLYLNDPEFAVIVPRIAKASCYIYAAMKIGMEECFSRVFEETTNRIDRACQESENSSLKIYEQRLKALVWGPKQYQRDETTLRIAHDALDKNQIVAFYGLGGVGKTALAQKLMFDIINNREPYTHIVTHSSKVGSDQKEINTIAPSRDGLKRKTDESVSVMDTSLFEDEGVRIIGGLRSLMLKIYKEVSTKPGDNYGDIKLRKLVFDELKKIENRVLIILDNYEDVEDNLDDSDVQQIRSEIKEFLTEFSRLSGDVKSRIIITTRSTPLDIAHGIEVKHLKKSEAANLFLEKIKFRSNRANKDLNLQKILTVSHQLISQTPEVMDELIDAFDLWDANDEYIAHPLLVLLAAEEIEKAEIPHFKKIIHSWGDGQKAKNVIEYCVKKSFGAVTAIGQLVLKLLVIEGHSSTDINNQYIRELIDDAISPNTSIRWMSDSERDELKTISDDILIDLMIKMNDRTFVQVVPKNTMGGGMCYHWNKLVYEHLQTRFEEKIAIPKPTSVESDITNLESYPPSFEFLSNWTKSEAVTSITQVLTNPLEESIDEMAKELRYNLDSKPVQYDLNSLLTNLEYQSFHLCKLLRKIVQIMKSDQQLTGIQKNKAYKSVEIVLDTLLKCLGRQARCWRDAATLNGTGYAPSLCIHFSMNLLDELRRWAMLFHDADILKSDQFINLIEKIGHELIEIANTNVEINETQTEKLNALRMNWLEYLANYYQPQDRKLKDGLELEDNAYSSFETWVEVFQETNVIDRNKQIYLIEGYAFWIILRMFAANTNFSSGKETTILDELKEQGLAISSVPNISQYIRSVQSSLEQIIVDPIDYLSNILLYRSQPRNGTLFITKLRYDRYFSRWSRTLSTKLGSDWELIVNETDTSKYSKNYEKVIIKQESINRTNKRIIASFYLNDEGEAILAPEENMKIRDELEKQWSQQIDKIIKERKEEGRNEISMTEIRRLLNKSNGHRGEGSILDIVKRNTDLVKHGNYFIIDSSKPHSPPPFDYESVDGGGDTFTQTSRRDRIQLPRDPVHFSYQLHHFISMTKKKKSITMLEYSREVENIYNKKYQSGAFMIFLALHKYESTWIEKKIIEIPTDWTKFVKEIENAVIGKCDIIEQDYGYEISKKVIKLYFQEVSEFSPEQID